MAVDSRNGRVGGSDLPGEVVADILSADRRRVMLRVLAEAEESVIVEDLAAAVAAREGETDLGSVDPETRRAVRDGIYDRHLPKLLATGVVEFDSMRCAVRLVDESVLD
jgi:hypothetical protein